ncbi:flavin reductase family protein [Candidatus Omnitrophota bacterium]
MKSEVSLNKANRLINSGHIVLVTSAFEKKVNIATIAWSTPVSHTPALLAISVAKKHYTAELIQSSYEFIVNIPTFDLLEQVLLCGAQSGRTVDKFAATKLTVGKSHCLEHTPLIEECIGHIECRVKQAMDSGDHFLFVAEPVYASACADSFDGVWNTEKARLIFHCGGRFFASLHQQQEV